MYYIWLIFKLNFMFIRKSILLSVFFCFFLKTSFFCEKNLNKKIIKIVILFGTYFFYGKYLKLKKELNQEKLKNDELSLKNKKLSLKNEFLKGNLSALEKNNKKNFALLIFLIKLIFKKNNNLEKIIKKREKENQDLESRIMHLTNNFSEIINNTNENNVKFPKNLKKLV